METGTYVPSVSGPVASTSLPNEKMRAMTDDQTRAKELAERIERSDHSDIELGKLAGVSKDTVKKARNAGSLTIGKVRAIEQALEDIESRTAKPQQVEPGVITFTVRGHFGVEATVAGPVENLAELQSAVRELIVDLKAEQVAD